MAIPPKNSLGTIRSYGSFSSGTGYQVNVGMTKIAKSNSPVLNPPTLIGSDYAQIDNIANPSNLLSFSKLLKEGTLVIPQGATLLYTLSGTGATPVVTTTQNIKIINSQLGAGSYKLFQAQVDPTVMSGTVYAQLYYQP